MRHEDAVDMVIMRLQKEFGEDNKKMFDRNMKFNHNVPDISYKTLTDTYMVAEIGTFPSERLTAYLINEYIGIIRWYNRDCELIGIWKKSPKHYYPIKCQLPGKYLKSIKKHLTDEKHG